MFVVRQWRNCTAIGLKVRNNKVADLSCVLCRPKGKAKTKMFVVKTLAQLWADRQTEDALEPTKNAGKSVSTLLMFTQLHESQRSGYACICRQAWVW